MEQKENKNQQGIQKIPYTLCIIGEEETDTYGGGKNPTCIMETIV